MYNEQIKYVREQRAAGHSHESIVAALRAAGYDETTILAVLSAVDESAHATGVVSGAQKNLIPYEVLFNGVFTLPLSLWKVYGVGTLVMGMCTVLLFGVFSLVVAQLLFGGLFGMVGFSSGMFVLAAAAFVVLLWVISCVGFALLRAVLLRQQQVGFWSSVRWVGIHLGSMTLVLFIMQLAISGAFIFLIIPGIILTVYAAFTYHAYLSEDRKGFDALLRSVQLVSGHWWGVVLRFLAIMILLAIFFGVLSIIASLIPVLGTVLAVLGMMYMVAVSISASVYLFESLQQIKPPAHYQREAISKTVVLGLRICVAIGALLMLWQVYTFTMQMMMVAQFLTVDQSLPIPNSYEQLMSDEFKNMPSDRQRAELEQKIIEQIDANLEQRQP